MGRKQLFKYMSSSRYHDIIELYKELDQERNPETRRSIEHTIQVLKNESGAIRSMRESLLRAHRNSDIEEVKDIHDYIAGKERYGSNRQL